MTETANKEEIQIHDVASGLIFKINYCGFVFRKKSFFPLYSQIFPQRNRFHMLIAETPFFDSFIPYILFRVLVQLLFLGTCHRMQVLCYLPLYFLFVSHSCCLP